MLGKTAGGLYWLFRAMERCETNARLVSVGQRIALTRSAKARSEWSALLTAAGTRALYEAEVGEVTQEGVIDWLLRARANPSSVHSQICAARDSARTVRTALTREVWEAINEAWMRITAALSQPVTAQSLPAVLTLVRQRSAFVRGAMHGTMMRNDIFDFCRLGTFMERADSTARLLDVKYHVLLPSAASVGGTIDTVQWETILRAVSSEGGYRWLHGGDVRPREVAEFLMLDRRMPRSMAFCTRKIAQNLDHIWRAYGAQPDVLGPAERLAGRLESSEIETIFEGGLHEFVRDFLTDLASVHDGIQTDFRFYA